MATVEGNEGSERKTIYKVEPQPTDWIKDIKSSPNPPPTPSKASYGIDSPLGLVASNVSAPLYAYTSLKGKHDKWDSLLTELPNKTFSGASLDIGCGRGMVLLKVAQRKRSLQAPVPAYGVDVFNNKDQTGNAPQATYANAACLGVVDNVVLHTGDFTALPFADGVFSLCTSSLALHNVDGERRKRGVEELARVCAPGAKMILVDLQGYTRGYRDTLKGLGWTDVNLKFGGVQLMFGWWPCWILDATKPLE